MPVLTIHTWKEGMIPVAIIGIFMTLSIVCFNDHQPPKSEIQDSAWRFSDINLQERGTVVSEPTPLPDGQTATIKIHIFESKYREDTATVGAIISLSCNPRIGDTVRIDWIDVATLNPMRPFLPLHLATKR